MDAVGNVYIADTGNNVIRKIDAATGIIRTIAGTHSYPTAGPNGDGGAATAARIAPTYISADAAGNVYFVDQGSSIRQVNASGNINTVVTATTAGGTLAGLATDASGNPYIANSGANIVQKLSSPGAVLITLAGTGTAGYSGDGGLAANAQLNRPLAVALDEAGNVYIEDNAAIRRVDFKRTTARARLQAGLHAVSQ
ncbi:MAG: hypothetical protein JOY54_19410 [Acidobacteriaceae bacterium]|nr:hypothetical protein [Acidobacteriaceae bacterium]